MVEWCMFSHIYFFVKSTFSIPVSAGKMKNKLSRFGKLNYSSCFPVSRIQFLIHPVSKSCAIYFAAISMQMVTFISLPFNFEFSPETETLFSIKCCISTSMPLQSSCVASICVNNFCPGHKKNSCTRLLVPGGERET